jgi:hypothetical protein
VYQGNRLMSKIVSKQVGYNCIHSLETRETNAQLKESVKLKGKQTKPFQELLYTTTTREFHFILQRNTTRKKNLNSIQFTTDANWTVTVRTKALFSFLQKCKV